MSLLEERGATKAVQFVHAVVLTLFSLSLFQRFTKPVQIARCDISNLIGGSVSFCLKLLSKLSSAITL